MPLSSMTGFARHDGTFGSVRWYWEVRSVNSRGLDVRLRLAPGFDSLEPKVREAVSTAFNRGSLSISLSVQREATGPTLKVNEAALQQVLAAVEHVRAVTGAPPPSADGLLAIRGVLETDEGKNEEADLVLHAAMLESLATALAATTTARRAEGARLAAIVGEQVTEIERLATLVRESPSRRPDHIQSRLRDLVHRLVGANGGLDPERLHQEAVLAATRADVEEELKRLGAHIESARALLSESGPVGRRLDFLAQELNREANTLTSKAIDVEISRAGLALKAVIDQMREQVQNIE